MRPAGQCTLRSAPQGTRLPSSTADISRVLHQLNAAVLLLFCFQPDVASLHWLEKGLQQFCMLDGVMKNICMVMWQPMRVYHRYWQLHRPHGNMQLPDAFADFSMSIRGQNCKCCSGQLGRQRCQLGAETAQCDIHLSTSAWNSGGDTAAAAH